MEVKLIPSGLIHRMCVLFLRPRLPGTAMRRGALASHRCKKDPSVSSVSLCDRSRRRASFEMFEMKRSCLVFYYIVAFEMINDFILSKERD